MLEVSALKAAVGGREILHGLDLELRAGETVVLLGKNGAGKSTLAKALLRGEWEDKRDYQEKAASAKKSLTIAGKIKFEGRDISNWSTEQRARAGMFLAAQQPVEVVGVSTTELLKASLEARDGKKWQIEDVQKELVLAAKKIGVNIFTAERELNVGFSGGEKKKNEILQMMVLKPRFAVLDEPDSGLDFQSTKRISQALADFQKETNIGYLIISHNLKILEKLPVTKVYLLEGGRIVQEGGEELLWRED